MQKGLILCGVDMNDNFIVICPECGEEHSTLDVDFLNVEEDMQGRDVMHFVCPITNKPAKSLVYKK